MNQQSLHSFNFVEGFESGQRGRKVCVPTSFRMRVKVTNFAMPQFQQRFRFFKVEDWKI